MGVSLLYEIVITLFTHLFHLLSDTQKPFNVILQNLGLHVRFSKRRSRVSTEKCMGNTGLFEKLTYKTLKTN